MDLITEKLKPLEKLVGTWKTTGKVFANEETHELPISGTDTYAWLPGGYFLLHTADVMIGNERSQTHEVIGYEENKQYFFTHYFNNRGQYGNMIIMVSDHLWVFHGGTLRFTGSMTSDDRELSGTWEKLDEDKNWIAFMEIRLLRAS